MDSEIKDFYRYYATMMEPWDGPASILFTDGDVVGAILDRNGLRPSRYYITDDGYMILSSEVGAIDIDQTKVIKKRPPSSWKNASGRYSRRKNGKR